MQSEFRTPARDELENASRRAALTRIAGGLFAAALPVTREAKALGVSAGRLKQSVCRWPYRAVQLPELCRRVKRMGFAGIDLLYVDEWQLAHDAGLTVSMGYPSRREKFIETGFNNPANHALLLSELEIALPLAGRAGVANLIGMFGNRDPARDDRAAIDSCIAGLTKIAPLAEESGVTLCVELLNSRIDHPGYQGDHTAFGVAVMKGVNSPRVKLLYDIYHMQIMEGDVIRTIRDNIQWIGHFHTGGVPGRHEIDASQELNYRAIALAIAELGYTGYVAHEFIPTRPDPYASLADAFRICSV
ncbi:MAG: hydroxypyruvate isomerase family protein [Steroidobacteraceae bacterium]